MYGSIVIGIRWKTIGDGIKAIGLGHRMPALVGGFLVMSAGNTLKVTGKEITDGYRMTTTGTVTGTGTFARKNGVGAGVGARIDSSGGSNNPTIYVSPSRTGCGRSWVSTWIAVTPGQEKFYIAYSRSMHYDFNTLLIPSGEVITQGEVI
jgi:hypothetical protein